MADVRTARTEEKIGHSGRDGRGGSGEWTVVDEERTHPLQKPVKSQEILYKASRDILYSRP